MNLADLIARNAAFTPQKAAIHFMGETLTYADLTARIEQAARGLHRQLGVAQGDRLAVLAFNHPDLLVLLYACARLGAMLVPLNWRLAVPELLFILSDAAVNAVVVESALGAKISPLRRTAPEIPVIGLDYIPEGGGALSDLIARGNGEIQAPRLDRPLPLLIVYTSGTTGRPKGAVLTQQALIANAVMSQHMHDMTSNDHVLTVLPMFHVGGLNIQTTPALQLGATVTLHARFAAGTALAAITQDRPTLTVLVPATIEAMIEHCRWAETPLDSLRAVTTGSTQVPQPLVDAWTARGVPVLQVYGSTETCPIAVYTRLTGDWRRRGTAGLSGLLCEARIVDERGHDAEPDAQGEILVRGPNVFCEYWGNRPATAEALRERWFHTGDIGTRDPDGYFFIHDRKSNVIISGGENIYPAEVERVLHQHPAVAEAAVVGWPDPKWQEVPVACIVRRSGTAAEPTEIEAFLLKELARYKVPRRYLFVDSLPRNALGKIQHFRLKEVVAAQLT